MKLKEMLEQIEDVEITEEQEKQIKDFLGIKRSKKWRPKKSEKYFYINCYGDIDYCVNSDDEDDMYGFLTNNYFKTKEEAEFRLEQIKVYNELKDFSDENNDEINWKDENEDKFYIAYIHSDKQVSYFSAYSLQDIGQIYFSSEELAKQAIEKVGEDRIKKYLFGVE